MCAPVMSLLCVLFCVSAFARAGSLGLGDITRIERAESRITFHTSSGAVAQINVLKPDLFRLWIGPAGTLETEGSTLAPIVVEKEFAPVNFSVDSNGNEVKLTTNSFVLTIQRAPMLFALYRSDGHTCLWRELMPLQCGDGGCTQTLSSHAGERFFGGGQQNGSFEFKGKVMEIAYSDGWEEGDRPNPAPFYMSSLGYGVLRNSWADGRYDFWSDDYVTTTHQEDRFDAYYMVGESIHRVLDLYTQLTGRAGLLPRWGFEYGDADCYNDHDNSEKPGTVPPGWTDGPTGTTPDVVASVAAKYREFDMPGGWILPNDGYGCGYTDLPAVVEKLKAVGFQTGLWTESGVEKIAWEVGKAGTRVQKLDVAWTGKGYQFALNANHEAARGIIENSPSRPFVWTVMGWAGVQRYAVTWTGDQSGSWDYIRWHVPTLIGSGLSGMVYSTGDVDGIYGGSPETFTRDLQWKCFTPVLMGMSGWSKNERKHPWWFEEPYRSINRTYLKLKMRLTPYMYTLAHEAEKNGSPIVRGVVWDFPDDVHAFDPIVRNQFLLGNNLLIAPVYRSQAVSGGYRDSVYLPSGAWIDYWDGTVTTAGSDGRFIDYPVTLERLPLFVKAGAILPMYPSALYDGQVPQDTLTLDVYPAGESSYMLYEDDGRTREYQTGKFSTQAFSVHDQSSDKHRITVEIAAAEGEFEGMYENRVYALHLHVPVKPTRVVIDGVTAIEVLPEEYGSRDRVWHFAAGDRHGVVSVKTGMTSSRERHTIEISCRNNALDLPASGLSLRAKGDGTISRDNLAVINRPAEEPGYPLENAFDRDPKTWFRTVRDQSVSYGPHEFTLSLGERRVIDGFQIAPRNDKWWKYGQVFEYELYMSESNGDWGAPFRRDTLRLSDSLQTVRFAPVAGRVFRFRVLSTHDMREDSAAGTTVARAHDPLATAAVKPVTISEFRILEHQLPDSPRRQQFLTDFTWNDAECSHGTVQRITKAEPQPITLDGINFERGYRTPGNSHVDFELTGNWQNLRVEGGLEPAGAATDTVRFQIHGDGKLLFESAPVTKGGVAKMAVDIRGVRKLSLCTVSSNPSTVSGWANPQITGFVGDRVGK